jgi:uncharacterized protein YndB with AHSA1/START domain
MKTIEVTVTRTINGPPDQVFDVWLDTKSPGGPWFGAERVVLNAEVDGLFFIAMKQGERGRPHYGRFIRLERGRTIEHTWMSESTHGLETTVTITLTARDGKTDFVLRHVGLPDDDDGRAHERGWNWFASRVEERFAH